MPVAPVFAISLAIEGMIDDSGNGWYVAAFFLPLVLMLLFQRKYPRWWFDFLLELTPLPVPLHGVYLALLTDKYPSTDEEQDVHLELDYPDAEQLHRALPIVKWLLLIPHYIALAILGVAAVLVVIAAWFAILITGRYPRLLFDFVVGVGRYGLRSQRLRLSPDHRPLPTV